MDNNRRTDPDLGNMSRDNGTRGGDSLGSRIGDRARSLKDSAVVRADDAKASLGRSVEEVAQKVRDSVPGDGRMHDAADRVASQVESAGRYLQEADFDEMAHDVTNLVRKYPLQSVGIGLGIGFLLARLRR